MFPEICLHFQRGYSVEYLWTAASVFCEVYKSLKTNLKQPKTGCCFDTCDIENPVEREKILEYLDMQEIIWNGEIPIYSRIMKIWRFIVLV